MKISVIVPTFGDGEFAEKNLKVLRDNSGIEVIVVDAEKAGRANRAFQMNLGAQKAKGDYLLFLHADTRVDPGDLVTLSQIMDQRPELVGGAFRFTLDQMHWKARLIEFGVRLRELIFKLPYGDQALFVRRSVFEDIGGYPDVPILEDVLLVKKLGRGFLYFSGKAVTSARRWEHHGYLKTTLVNWVTMILWRVGVSLETIISFRRRVLNDAVRGDIKKQSARNQTETA